MKFHRFMITSASLLVGGLILTSHGYTATTLTQSSSPGMGQEWRLGGSRIDQRTSSHDITLQNETVSMLSAGRDVQLMGTTVTGNVSAGHNVIGSRCTIQGQVSGGHDVQMTDCPMVNQLAAGQNLRLTGSRVGQHASAGRDLILQNTVIEGDASAGGQVAVQGSEINGTLSLAAPHLRVENSALNHIRFTVGGVSSNQSVYLSQSNLAAGNSGVTVTGQSGRPTVNAGSRSVSNINGYVIRAANGETTVITPDNTIYVNGRRVSGSGPSTYTEYRRKATLAPIINGPGWRDTGAVTTSDDDDLIRFSSGMSRSTVRSTSTVSTASDQVLELAGNTVVRGNIVFESGQGKVIVHPGARLMGKVQGGTIEQR